MGWNGTVIVQCGVLEEISGSLGCRNSDEGGREEKKGCDNMIGGEVMAIT
jgi:hypothetical protein